MRVASLSLVIATPALLLLAATPAIAQVGTAGAPPLFKRYNLRCLAPLLKDLDPEEPENLDQAFLAGPAGSADPVSADDPAADSRIGASAVNFPITTESPEVQALFNRGVALLHTLWYREAENAFRAVVHRDPDCAMGYWGLAMANELRPGRARLFARTAAAKTNRSRPRLEQRWIDMLADYHGVRPAADSDATAADPESGATVEARAAERIRALENLVIDFPEEVEARAFFLRQLALDQYRIGIPITSALGVEGLADDLAAAAPDHPSRHYPLFVWLDRRPERGLAFADASPPLSPAVADVWRYAAEAYAAAGRVHEAIALHEAALRVDHRLMEARHLMPWETQSLAANYEVMIDTLGGMGRTGEALAWARRAAAFPTATLARGDAPITDRDADLPAIGRRLYVETLARAEQWETLLEEVDSGDALRSATTYEDRAQRLFWKGLALTFLDRADEAAAVTGEFEELLKDALREGVSNSTERDITSARGAFQACAKLLGEADPAPLAPGTGAELLTPELLALLYDKAGLTAAAAALAHASALAQPRRVLPVAYHTHLAFKTGNRKEASLQFNRLFRAAAAHADPETPALRRLDSLAAEMQLPTPWTLAASPEPSAALPKDAADLGPAAWTPPAAPDFSLPDHTGRNHTRDGFAGKPVLLNFFLGINCAFCVEQLNVFKEHLGAFKEAGIDFVAVSTDPLEMLQLSFGDQPTKKGDLEKQFPFLVLADPELSCFRAYRAYDDFEGGPLHATVLLDGRGRVLWADRGHAPFEEPAKLLREALRLLALHGGAE